ncbi:MAG: zinc ribbon domain-containing protein, partial [Methanolinea sp.]
LTDPGEVAGGVTAKEIPRESIVDCYIEHSPLQEPILVLSVRTSEDEVRTMKMTFVHTGKDRVTEAEEWMHLVKHSRPHLPGGLDTRERAQPLSAEARALSETVVFPPQRPQEFPRPAASDVAPRDTRMKEKDVPAARPTPPPPPPRVDSSPTQIQFCYHCGHRIPPVANYCPYCGTRMVHVHGQPAAAPPRAEHVQGDTAPQDSKTKKRGIWDIFRRLRRGS